MNEVIEKLFRRRRPQRIYKDYIFGLLAGGESACEMKCLTFCSPLTSVHRPTFTSRNPLFTTVSLINMCSGGQMFCGGVLYINSSSAVSWGTGQATFLAKNGQQKQSNVIL